jgi:hypothetical protein
MTMPPTTLHVPVVTLGPCGSGFLSVDPSPEEALTHLDSHGSATPEVSVPAHDELTFFDGRARLLRLDTSTSRPRLTVADDGDHSGELRSRVDEAFAHARERAYRDPSLLEGTAIRNPAKIQPPSKEDLDDYLDALRRMMSFEKPPEQHAGSWLHNLFHRIG